MRTEAIDKMMALSVLPALCVGIQQSHEVFHHKGQQCANLFFFLICLSYPDGFNFMKNQYEM